MLAADLEDFGHTDIRHRLLRGGLPPFFLAEQVREREFQEWMDAYWAKDILELFRLERRHSFQQLAQLLFIASGGIFEATRFAGPCEVSRTTVSNYLAVLEATFVVHVLRPFASNPSAEIVSAPKVYGFDTGFVCYHRGWETLREQDLGVLWEHFVLNEMHGCLQTRALHYWRDKRGHEVDIVIVGRKRRLTAIECKWSADAFDPSALAAFRRRYPAGDNYVVAADISRSWTRRLRKMAVQFVSPESLISTLEEPA